MIKATGDLRIRCKYPVIASKGRLEFSCRPAMRRKRTLHKSCFTETQIVKIFREVRKSLIDDPFEVLPPLSGFLVSYKGARVRGLIV